MSACLGGPILSIDPGSEKCGLAVVSADGSVLERAVVPTQDLCCRVAEAVSRHRPARLVMGNRTTAQRALAALREAGISLEAEMVEEHGSSQEARRRFFAENPPRGWRRLLPRVLLEPDRPYDDLVAVILAERYLGRACPR